MEHIRSHHLIWALFAAASLVLAVKPVIWLVQSWLSPAYASQGYVFVGLIAALVLRSLASGPAAGNVPAPAVWLLLIAAALRLASQTLAINILGGLALAADIFAIVALLRLDQRPFALSPFWLSALFIFALPVEMVLERALGFPLQMISAELSCGILRAVFSDVTCNGVRITVEGQDVLVDLPCSGATGLLLTLAAFTTLNALYRPRLWVAAMAGLATLALAIIGNAFRISLLAGGLVHGFDVMAEPAHSAIGLVTLALGLTPLFLWYRPRPATRRIAWPEITLPRPAMLGLAMASLAGAVAIVSLPGKPVDISQHMTAPALPLQLAGHRGRNVPLTPLETYYFEAYGGAASKAQFGPLGLNIVSTTSPLRHLHGPEACLRGLGYTVRFLGTQLDGLPTALYRATGPDGRDWRVSVSFVSNTGHITPSVGEAVWHWMTGAAPAWRSVQRITPWDMPAPDHHTLEAAAIAALDLPMKTKGL